MMIGSSATCAFLFPEGALPSEASDGEECVYLAVKLSPETLRTSDLLDGISGTSGYAKLPCGISDEDVLLWRSSSPNQAVPPLPKLQGIIKVILCSSCATWSLDTGLRLSWSPD